MKRYWYAALGLMACGAAQAATVEVKMNLVTGQGIGQDIGKVSISETPYGLLFTPQLKALPAGVHGFHVHEKGSCEPGMKDGKAVAALAAGGHLDPQKTGKHLGPYGDGHLGDLPAIYVTDDGTATYPVLAPRLKKISEIEGKALMVHAGGDNSADHPMPLGGGGERFACGVIK
ncbi:Superoxide dismutase [Cu-Zn] precursor [Serratia entomophila]|jgi:Cu-Zn family superoxide dismutase|uniref:Superoxide dismutase [Cu-Zn] n=1 Tax=Serratia entomophila TaxID=42906 RepID=A0ABY5CYD1_9GAMM|nr:superoxide dismutase [Cu-Zn] SodC [Serratia entomophila]UIW20465.1 superoxide dismutase family protein [Serratia entomophila]USV02967.1 superoxide dismutase family protein [Serratia entomophila]CAI0696273.1 Superoxide dismutase [Cu-Zn] precursor [Serratia entomophila]CAI0704217.1 Superoxide dismutase [Cu-Zn] precursor [Serratia entomophila]CAI0733751.1 Superoxide dismutase [Cu-Zn] precursor [Serratia entomophila]